MVTVGVLIACYLIAQVSDANENLPGKWFRCNNGEYIYSIFFCDRNNDCTDDSDEGTGCSKPDGLNYFTCIADGIPHTMQPEKICDTIKDCEDGSDEANCGNQLNVSNCSLSDWNFLCHDNKRCLDFRYTCDRNCNCFDCSDENENCTAHDPQLEQKCVSGYLTTPNGPACLCDEANNSQFSSICNSIENCSDTESLECSHKCFKLKNTTFCSCNEGYHSIDTIEGPGCRSNSWFGNTLLYSTATEIKSLNLTANQTSVIRSEVDCTALAGAGDYVYYATTSNLIFKAPINSYSAEGEKLIESVAPVNSIAIDYVTGNIYYTANHSLFVCTGRGQRCTQLKCCNVFYVALAPKFGLMFYIGKWAGSNSEKALPGYYIIKANMDGSNEAIFVNATFLIYKFPIAVDEEKKSIVFFVEPYHSPYTQMLRVPFGMKMTSEKMTTSSKEFLNRNSAALSIAVIDETVFYTVKGLGNTIYYLYASIHEETLSYKTANYFRENSTTSVKYLWAHNGLIQRSIQNPCDVASCIGLCLVRPTSAANSPLTYTCYQNTTCQSDNTHSYANQTTTPKQNTENRGNFTSEEDSLSSSKHPKSTEFSQSSQSSQNHNILIIVSVLLVLLVLAIGLGFARHFTIKKLNWYRYYGDLRSRSWKWNKNTDLVEIVRDEGM